MDYLIITVLAIVICLCLLYPIFLVPIIIGVILFVAYKSIITMLIAPIRMLKK